MTLSPRDALAQKLDVLARIAGAEGWCPKGTRLIVQLAEGYPETTERLSALRWGLDEDGPGGWLHPQNRSVETDSAPSFLWVVAAALQMDGHAYILLEPLNPQRAPVFDIPRLGTAHERLAITDRMMDHLRTLGWTNNSKDELPDLIRVAHAAVVHDRPPPS